MNYFLVTLCGLVNFSLGLQAVEFETKAGRITAKNEQGKIMWARGGVDPQRHQSYAKGFSRIGAKVVSTPTGELALMNPSALNLTLAKTRNAGEFASWSELEEIIPEFDKTSNYQISVAQGDASGNVFVVLTRYGASDYEILLSRRGAEEANWQKPQSIINTDMYLHGTEAVTTSNGDIYIFYRGLGKGQDLFYSVVSEGEVGASQLLYSSDNFFQNIETGVDAKGNITVVFDPVNKNYAHQLVSLVFDTVRQDWSEPQKVSGGEEHGVLSSVIFNRSGEVGYLLYMERADEGIRFNSRKFDSLNRRWGVPKVLDTLDSAMNLTVAPFSKIPGFVDEQGNLVAFWYSYGVVSGEDVYNLNGIHLHADTVISKEQVAPSTYSQAGLYDFAQLSMDRKNNLDLAFTILHKGENQLWLVQFSNDQTWLPVRHLYSSDVPWHTRTRITSGSSAKAISFYGDQEGEYQFTSIVSEDDKWSEELTDIPGEYLAFFQEAVGFGDQGLLVFSPATMGEQLGLNSALFQ